VVLGLADRPEPPHRVPVALTIHAGDGPAVLITGNGLVSLFGLEVGRGGVEEQQVDFQVEEVGDLTLA
jgi:hypothetical protein